MVEGFGQGQNSQISVFWTVRQELLLRQSSATS